MIHFPKSYFIFVLKVGILTIVFSILALFLFNRQEKIPYTDHHHNNDDTPGEVIKWGKDNSVDKEQAHNLIENLVENEFIQREDQHHSPSEDIQAQQKYEQICTRYENICDKTTRQGSYNDLEKLRYQALIIYLLEKEDQYLQDTPLETMLSYIKLYEDFEGRRGSAGHQHIIINTAKIDNGKELRQVLSHELGHIIDFSLLKGNSSTKDAHFTEFNKATRSINDPSLDFYTISWKDEHTRKKDASYKDFVSGYAMKDIYEDFAESVQLFFNHHGYFLELATSNQVLQKKYDYINNLYNQQFFKSRLFPSYPFPDQRKWDSTKIE